MSARAPSFATGLSAAIGPRARACVEQRHHGGRRRARTARACSASSDVAVVRDRDDRRRPSSRSAARASATSSAQVRASCPKVGSSSTSTRGAVASAAATVSRRFSPPESVYGFASASGVEPQPLEQLVDARRDLGARRARGRAARPRAPPRTVVASS